MTRWEYIMLRMEPGGFLASKYPYNEIEQALNQLGNAGWELVSETHNALTGELVYWLKRPLPEPDYP